MYILLVLLLALAGCSVFFYRKEIEYVKALDKKKEPLRVLYPMAGFILKAMRINKGSNARRQNETIRALYPDKKPDEIKDRLNRRCCATVLTVIIASLALSVIYQLNESMALRDGRYIERNKSGSGSKKLELVVEPEEAGQQHDVNIEIMEKRLMGEKRQELMNAACEYVEKAVLGENTSAEEIRHPLNLITEIGDMSVKVKWTELDSSYIHSDGTLRNQDLSEPVIVYLTAELTYYDTQIYHSFPVQIRPIEITEEMSFMQKLENRIKADDEKTSDKDFFELPEELDRSILNWREKSDYTWLIILIGGIIASVAVVFGMHEDRKKDMERRREQMLRDYPEIISKITILLTAGLPIRAAWERIVNDYRRQNRNQRTDNKRYAYEEMLITCNEMDLGVPEITAYERFGRRCRVPSYQRFSTILARNIRRGSRNIIPLLELEADDAFQERKENVRQLGEKAGTKLLGPMIGIFGIILAIVIVPAFSTMI